MTNREMHYSKTRYSEMSDEILARYMLTHCYMPARCDELHSPCDEPASSCEKCCLEWLREETKQ